MSRVARPWFRRLPAGLALAGMLLAGRNSPADLDLARRLNEAFVQAAESASAAVVVIRVRPKVGSAGDFDHGNLFRFLPEEMQKELRERMERENNSRRRELPPDFFPEQGSGVVIREDGYILTNGHVVEEADKIEVRLKDGRRLPAEVKGIDPESDIAVLKVEATGMPAARLGDSSRVRVGEFAIAIGAPFELEYSVTFGHVSAKGRRVLSDVAMMDQDFIQTDASINQGNSGGPLVNIEGEVIGINSMIRGVNTGIGFAVPINLAREVANQLIESGRFTRAWLGVNIESLADRPSAGRPAVPVRDGVIVTRILRDGPSWGSELEIQDVIVSIDNQAVRDITDLKRLVSRKPIGKPVDVEVYRGDKRLKLNLTPGELPQDRMASLRPGRTAPPTQPSEPASPDPQSAVGLGLVVKELDPDNASRVGLEDGEGVLVTEVAPDSPAAERRIRPGEVITKINRRPVRNPREFAAATRDLDLSKGVSVTIVGEAGRRFEVLRQVGR